MSKQENASFVTLEKIVRSALIDMGENSLHKFARCLNFAFEGVKDYYADCAQQVKSVKLEMDDIKQVELPADFVDWVKVGIRCGDKIKTFGVNNDMPLLHDEDACGNPVAFERCACGVNELPTNYAEIGGYSFFNYINEYGEILGGLYGIGGGYTQRGYFRVDKENRVIQFNSSVTNTEVYMEYIATGFDPSSETLVPVEAEKAIKFYIHWRVAQHKDGSSSGNAMQWRWEYYEEIRKARRRTMDFTINDIIELGRKYFMQSPKY